MVNPRVLLGQSNSTLSLVDKTSLKYLFKFLSCNRSPNLSWRSQKTLLFPDVKWDSSSLDSKHLHNQFVAAYFLLCEKFPANGNKPYLVQYCSLTLKYSYSINIPFSHIPYVKFFHTCPSQVNVIFPKGPWT